MGWLKLLTYLSLVGWLFGIYAEHAGDPFWGADIAAIFGILTLLLLVANILQWIFVQHGSEIAQSTISFGQWMRRSSLLIACALGAILYLWMNAYETLPGGWSHRNRITGFVCNIEKSCWLGQ